MDLGGFGRLVFVSFSICISSFLLVDMGIGIVKLLHVDFGLKVMKSPQINIQLNRLILESGFEK